MKILLPFILTTSFIFLSACGGGGNESGGSNENSGLEYSGSTNQAIINASNAKELSHNSYSLSQRSSSPFGPFSLTNASINNHASQTTETNGLPVILNVFNTILPIVNPLEKTTLPKNKLINTSTKNNSQDIINGSCGGNASLTMNTNNQSNSFSGSLIFNQFCDQGITINGSILITGSTDPNTEELRNFSMTFSSLQTTGFGDSFVMSGSVTAKEEAPNIILTMNLLTKNNLTQEETKLSNMKIAVFDSLSSSHIQMNGRIYHFQHGYIDLVTTETFIVNHSMNSPESGQLLITGQNGTKARLTAHPATYFVEADTTGDGIFDYSETFNWDE